MKLFRSMRPLAAPLCALVVTLTACSEPITSPSARTPTALEPALPGNNLVLQNPIVIEGVTVVGRPNRWESCLMAPGGCGQVPRRGPDGWARAEGATAPTDYAKAGPLAFAGCIVGILAVGISIWDVEWNMDEYLYHANQANRAADRLIWDKSLTAAGKAELRKKIEDERHAMDEVLHAVKVGTAIEYAAFVEAAIACSAALLTPLP